MKRRNYHFTYVSVYLKIDYDRTKSACPQRIERVRTIFDPRHRKNVKWRGNLNGTFEPSDPRPTGFRSGCHSSSFFRHHP
jgi:hypothetical protein